MVECSICICNINNSAQSTRCGHVFHTDCLSNWLIKSKTCPECREPCMEGQNIFLNISNDSELRIKNLEREISSLRDTRNKLKKLVLKTQVAECLQRQVASQKSTKRKLTKKQKIVVQTVTTTNGTFIIEEFRNETLKWILYPNGNKKN